MSEHGRENAAIGRWVRRFQSVIDGFEFRARLPKTHAIAQPSDRKECCRSRPSLLDLRGLYKRNPQVPFSGKIEMFRHDADNRRRRPVHMHTHADDIGAAPKAAHPKAMVENRDHRCAGDFIRWSEIASQHRPNAKKPECVHTQSESVRIERAAVAVFKRDAAFPYKRETLK